MCRTYNETAGAGRNTAAAFASRAGGSWLQGKSVSGTRGAARATVTVTGTSLSILPGFTGFAINQSASLPVERITG